jgi:tetratricopeptide (TPR) repeat protein
MHMDELAALTPNLMLPPVTDVRRSDELAALEQQVAELEAVVGASDYEEAIRLAEELRLVHGQYPDLSLRALFAESWARMYRGELDHALSLLKSAKELAHRPGFNDLDRAEVLYRFGCVRAKRGAFSRAANDLTLALELCERSGRPCDRLRAEILEWRSRCHQRQRDFDAARADVEHALELADGLDDTLAAAHVNFRASAIAQGEGRLLVARFYGEKAKELYESCGDRANVGRLLNDLGGIVFLLGQTDEAIAYLKQAIKVLFDAAGDVETGYAVSSLAQVYLRTGKPKLAEPQARKALKLLGDRDDAAEEIGNVTLVLGRSLLELGRPQEAEECFLAAEAVFESLEAPSLLAAALVARGDLASAGSDFESAAALYRRAAHVLQDFEF